MVLGKVMGSVWATHKEAGMDQLKLLLIQPLDFKGRAQGSTMIAADRIGAGIGEHVIVSRGNPARMLFDGRNVPIDAIVVGIVDGIELGDVKLSFDTEGGEEHD
jgi:ethanolamine utilization protein EutN